MKWVLVAAAIAFLVAAIRSWQLWVRPWREVAALLRNVSRGQRPSTFLVRGAEEPHRVGIALEEIFHQQRELERRIADRASGANAVFESLSDGLLIVNERREIRFVNQTFRNLFDTPQGDLRRPVMEIIRDPVVDRLIEKALKSGKPERGELAILSPERQRSREMQLSAAAIRGEDGQNTGAIVLFHDISELKQADQIRREFVANVSHELRTPLSILHGYIETLRDDPEMSRDDFERVLQVMNRHSDRLALLVNDLLTLSQLESGTPYLQLSTVRLTELYAGIARDWGRRFSDKQISIDIEVAPKLPILRADEARLQEILYNLLDNALKYTQPGGRIRLAATRQGEEVVIWVADNGPGIPEADLPRIFERFYRTDKARSREMGGTGLGLSIVKHIAQMHGGRVEAESTLGQGTTIRVILPIEGPQTDSVTET
jgi:two-component system phosphate regulon sensor histidine kinase PhoR